jgi:hypothetical protein
MIAERFYIDSERVRLYQAQSERAMAQAPLRGFTETCGECDDNLRKGEQLPKKMESNRLFSFRTRERIFADREDLR